MGHMERHHRKYLVGLVVASTISAVVAFIGWGNTIRLLDDMTQKYADEIVTAGSYQDSAIRTEVAAVTSNLRNAITIDSLKTELAKCKGGRPSVPAIPTKKPCKTKCVIVARNIGTPCENKHPRHIEWINPESRLNNCPTHEVPKDKCIPGMYENLMGRLPITGRYPDSTGGVWNGVWKDCK